MSPPLAARIRDAFIGCFVPGQYTGADRKEAVRECEIVLWEKSIWNAAARGSEDLEGSIRPDRTNEYFKMWLLNEPTKYQGINDLVPPGSMLIGEIVFDDLRCLITTTGDEPLFIRELITSPPGEPLTAGDCATISRMLFLDLPFIDFKKEELPRSIRRKYEREHSRAPEVKTVTLRRVNREDGATGEGSSSSDYSCQWVVSGHWRKQFYPSRNEHSPKYIAPYAKGPADKPFRPSRDTVYVAKR